MFFSFNPDDDDDEHAQKNNDREKEEGEEWVDLDIYFKSMTNGGGEDILSSLLPGVRQEEMNQIAERSRLFLGEFQGDILGKLKDKGLLLELKFKQLLELFKSLNGLRNYLWSIQQSGGGSSFFREIPALNQLLDSYDQEIRPQYERSFRLWVSNLFLEVRLVWLSQERGLKHKSWVWEFQSFVHYCKEYVDLGKGVIPQSCRNKVTGRVTSAEAMLQYQLHLTDHQLNDIILGALEENFTESEIASFRRLVVAAAGEKKKKKKKKGNGGGGGGRQQGDKVLLVMDQAVRRDILHILVNISQELLKQRTYSWDQEELQFLMDGDY